MIGGGTGPAAGTNATTRPPVPGTWRGCSRPPTPSPMNIGFTGKGNASLPLPLEEPGARRRHRPEAARGLRQHPGGDRQPPGGGRAPRHPGGDPHRHPQRIRLRRDHPPSAFQGPHHPHLPHRRAPAARHVLDIIKACGFANVLPSSRPTRHGRSPASHHRRAPGHADGPPPPRPGHRRGRGLSPSRASAARPSPPRTSSTTSARSGMISSDSQAMGRVGEVITRTWQTADKSRSASAAASTATVRATTTSAPGATSPSTPSTRRSPTASATKCGSVEAGKWADLVLWRPAFFGVEAEPDPQGAGHRRQPDGRHQRLDPLRRRSRCTTDRCSPATPAAVTRPKPDLRQSPPSPPAYRSDSACARPSAWSAALPRCAEDRPDPQRLPADHRGQTHMNYQVRADGPVALVRTGGRAVPMAQRYFLFLRFHTRRVPAPRRDVDRSVRTAWLVGASGATMACLPVAAGSPSMSARQSSRNASLTPYLAKAFQATAIVVVSYFLYWTYQPT
ncbi:hypothetical protein ACPA9J_04595 [Pseudomonas aeruginosa]